MEPKEPAPPRADALEAPPTKPQKWQVPCPWVDLTYGHQPDCQHCGGTRYVSIYYAKDVDPLLRAAALDTVPAVPADTPERH